MSLEGMFKETIKVKKS